ncbi:MULTISPECIES: transposase domain-containing protein [unclassified Streptomyces]|uniref:transposase domain-containing protein n=1 Tax=unclassified Streptomyces TaxID=2593676 RepID=UPI00403C595E
MTWQLGYCVDWFRPKNPPPIEALLPTYAPAAESVSASRLRASRHAPATGQLAPGAVTEIVPPALIDEVITRCGRRERRIRMLPARVTLYLVLGLWLYPSVGYREALRMLFEQSRHRASARHLRVPSAPAVVQARRRLGREPLKFLFLLLRGAHCDGPEDPGATAFGHDLALLTTAVDVTTLDVPDTVPVPRLARLPAAATGIQAAARRSAC